MTTVLAIALVASWTAASAEGCQAEKQRQMEEFEPVDPYAHIPPPPPADPEATTARVYIYLSRRGKVTVDSENLGKLTRRRVDLPPGDHSITAIIRGDTMTQMLLVKAGEEFFVEFDDKEDRIRLRRLHPVREKIEIRP